MQDLQDDIKEIKNPQDDIKRAIERLCVNEQTNRLVKSMGQERRALEEMLERMHQAAMIIICPALCHRVKDCSLLYMRQQVLRNLWQ